MIGDRCGGPKGPLWNLDICKGLTEVLVGRPILAAAAF